MNFFPALGSDSCETGTSKAASARLQDKGICGAWRGVSHRPSGMANHGAFWSAEEVCCIFPAGLLTFFSPSPPHSSDDFSLRSVQVQLWGAIGAVFKSCSSSRAKTYRELHDISEDAGSAAATVQAMVFGNGSGPDSASGVAFTRNPSSGDNHFYGEFLLNAQGEDLVGGIRTPAELTMQARLAHGNTLPSLEERMPKVFRELVAVREQLEKHYKDIHENVLPFYLLHFVAADSSLPTEHSPHFEC